MKLLFSLLRPICNLITVVAVARRYPHLRLYLSLTRHYANRRGPGVSVPLMNLLFSVPWDFALSHYHEVGHCESEQGFSDHSLQAEYAAWDWALHELALIKDLPTWGMSYNDAAIAFRHYGTYCLAKDTLNSGDGAMDSLHRLFVYYIKKDLENRK